MKRKHNYIAIPDGNPETCAYVCTAYSKKQMKAAGMNMKLKWERFDGENPADWLAWFGFPLKNWTDVTDFRY